MHIVRTCICSFYPIKFKIRIKAFTTVLICIWAFCFDYNSFINGCCYLLFMMMYFSLKFSGFKYCGYQFLNSVCVTVLSYLHARLGIFFSQDICFKYAYFWNKFQPQHAYMLYVSLIFFSREYYLFPLSWSKGMKI